jgi:hypothetical protein
MLETPESRAPAGAPYPADNLAPYRYHTGAPLRPLRPGETCPVLFRDVGSAAMARFLRGGLRRLAGPLTPLTYLRTEAYAEPYTDHERIGRLIFLRPLLLHPWHSGVPSIYVSRATRTADAATVGFVPGHIALAEAARLGAGLKDIREWRDALGGREYDEAAAQTLSRLDVLTAELNETEKRAEPLRRRLQSSGGEKERARDEMQRVGITEDDLCAAWHHLPRERRALLREALKRVTANGPG